jgi:hypothetical protein
MQQHQHNAESRAALGNMPGYQRFSNGRSPVPTSVTRQSNLPLSVDNAGASSIDSGCHASHAQNQQSRASVSKRRRPLARRNAIRSTIDRPISLCALNSARRNLHITAVVRKNVPGRCPGDCPGHVSGCLGDGTQPGYRPIPAPLSGLRRSVEPKFLTRHPNLPLRENLATSTCSLDSRTHRHQPTPVSR